MSLNNFRLTLDTIAPTSYYISYPSTSTAATYVQTSITVQFALPQSVTTGTDGAAFMKVWYDQSASTATAPSTYGNNTPLIWEEYSATKLINFHADSNAYYVHAVFMDNVNNVAPVVHSGRIVADRVGPTIYTSTSPYAGNNNDYTYAYDYQNAQAAYSKDFVNDLAFKVHLVANDGNSGIASITVSCEDFASDFTFTGTGFDANYAKDLDVAFASGTTAGQKQITVTVTDNSGNVSSHTVSIYFDNSQAEAALSLHASTADATAGTPVALADYVNTTGFVAKIYSTNNSTDIIKYQLYGDFEELVSSTWTTQSTATWKDWPTTGATSVVIDDLRFTNSDGTKHVYMRVMDKAGNIYPSDGTDGRAATDPIEVTRVYDATVPVVTISTNHTWIAENAPGGAGISAVNSATITYTCSDATAGFNAGGVYFTCNGTTITGITATTDGTSATFTFNKDTAGANSGTFTSSALSSGTNTIVIHATDKAGNTNTATTTVYIEPGFRITSLVLPIKSGMTNQYHYNTTTIDSLDALITIGSSDDPEARAEAHLSQNSPLYYTKIETWVSSTAADTTVPNNTARIDWGNGNTGHTDQKTIAKASIDLTSLAESTGNYVHVKVTDEVGNTAYKHIQFTYDTTAPSFTTTCRKGNTSSTPIIGNLGQTLTDTGATNSKTIYLTLSSVSDNLNELDKMKITCSTTLDAGATTSNDWVTYSSVENRAITLGTGVTSGTYTLTIQLRDMSNNITTQYWTWEYDAVDPEGTLVLKNNGTNNNKDNPTNDRAFRAVITFTDANDSDPTDDYGNIQYQIYGDFNTISNVSATGANVGTSYSENGTWVTMTSNPVVLDNLYLTTNTGLVDIPAEGVDKTIYVKLKDNAGNIKETNSVTIKLNQAAAELTISDITHRIVSCVHELRKVKPAASDVTDSTTTYQWGATSADTIQDYADLMQFTVTSNQIITDWKVIAYKNTDTLPSQGDSGASLVAMTARVGTNSPTGYTASGLTTTEWRIVIDGADYRAALGGSAQLNVDGIHYLYVFGKNQAGTWSLADAAETDQA